MNRSETFSHDLIAASLFRSIGIERQHASGFILLLTIATALLLGLKNGGNHWTNSRFESLQPAKSWGELEYEKFVFANVRHTDESYSDLWRETMIKFPETYYVEGEFIDERESAYEVNPVVMDLWDSP